MRISTVILGSTAAIFLSFCLTSYAEEKNVSHIYIHVNEATLDCECVENSSSKALLVDGILTLAHNKTYSKYSFKEVLAPSVK